MCLTALIFGGRRMISIDSLSIDDCYGVDFLYITFKVSGMVKPPEDYKMDLYKSVNQTEFFVMIAENLNSYQYTDRSVNLLNTKNEYFYQVKITDLNTGDVVASQIVRYNSVEPDRWAMGIEEIESRYLDYVIHEQDVQKAYLLQRRRTGARCSCWNPNRESTDNQFCEICYGTGYVGGYYPPIEIKMGNYNPSTYQNVFSPSEDTETIAPQQIWVRSVPKVENDDVIVDGSDRYIITAHTNTSKGRFLLRQICSLDLIPRSNVIFKFPVR